jgi:hypothetical protein
VKQECKGFDHHIILNILRQDNVLSFPGPCLCSMSHIYLYPQVK